MKNVHLRPTVLATLNVSKVNASEQTGETTEKPAVTELRKSKYITALQCFDVF